MLLQALFTGLLNGGIYSLVAVGLTLIFGVMRIINFAHGSLMMVGMYVSYWLFVLWGVDPYLSLIASASALFVVGLAIQAILISPVLEAPEHDQLLLTLGISLVVENLALFLWTADPRTITVPYLAVAPMVGGIMVSSPRVIAFVVSLGLTALLYVFLKRSDLGKAIRAVAQDREGALTVGIDIRRIYSLAFGIGCACVGAAGSLVVPFYAVEPYVGGVFVITAFVVVVLGGMGNVTGALLAALIVGTAESVAAVFIPAAMKQIVMYTIFVVVLLVRPQGLFGGRRV
ncbi:MAG: branched-chain amino acid ABC transporter permease [Candidatus Rokubacteria bacterium]|nr:branched-chain amino acid ABC transporter permease [Candidatus Rokubacteria bacterium]MBI2491539.1 branched-chain amino acid ABC transporter permease [Candidatus Rokubacteria bacterium]